VNCRRASAVISVAVSMSSSAVTPADLDRVFARVGGPARWSCAVVDLADGRLLYGLNAATPVIPASNQKLFTIAAALLALGPDYRSSTLFMATGPVVEGRLEGNVVVAGQGAIHFTARYPAAAPQAAKQARIEQQLAALAGRFRAAGISTVEGALLADSSAWSASPENPHYPSAGPLSFHENTLDVWVADGRISYCPEPLMAFQLLREEWSGSQEKVRIHGRPSDLIRVNPAVDGSDYWRLDAASPSQYYLMQVTAGLRCHGVAVRGKRLLGDGQVRRLFDLPSLPLRELLLPVGQDSDNFRAETLFLTLGRVLGGEASYPAAAGAVKDILRQAGLEVTGYEGVDGSGLDRRNRCSAGNVVALLQRMDASPHAACFRQCLAVAGRSGTLRRRLDDPWLQGRVAGKTGTLRDVQALSGYVDCPDGRRLAFSFMVNGLAPELQAWPCFREALRMLLS
jgi:serine-type D-Ala-D-Ala carboxypeptidase/endopeptidase (penicillin-binding protein 4)